MEERRRYQRYAVDYEDPASAAFEIKIEGEHVYLLDFSLGGFRVLSRFPFFLGSSVEISVDWGNQRTTGLTGVIVRVNDEGDRWEIAIDISQVHSLPAIRRV